MYELTPVARAYIFAAKQARTRADLATWMAKQKPRIASNLPAPTADHVIEQAREHWRALEGTK